MKQSKISKWAMATVVAMTMSGDAAWGQATPGVPRISPRPVEGSAGRVFEGESNKVEDPAFDIDFPGGTITEFIEVLNASRGRPVNILVNDGDRSVRIPRIEMKQVTIGTLLIALNRMADESGKRVVQFDGGNYATPGEPVFTFIPIRSQKDHAERVQFFNLEPYLTKNTVEDITTALNAGYQLKTGSSERLNLKFHKETQLLMVRGGPEELSMVADVLSQLKPSAPAKAPAATKPGEAAAKSSGQ